LLLTNALRRDAKSRVMAARRGGKAGAKLFNGLGMCSAAGAVRQSLRARESMQQKTTFVKQTNLRWFLISGASC
jgi:hypothetical protein